MSEKNQVQCNKAVRDTYYDGNNADINVWKKIADIFHDFPNQNIYLGITHHPCGRFTGDYDCMHLPVQFKDYESEKYVPPVNESGPHSVLYTTMFLLCSSSSIEKIKKLEIEVIKQARIYFPKRLGNSEKSGGGEGDFPKSNYYFLYACISFEILL